MTDGRVTFAPTPGPWKVDSIHGFDTALGVGPVGGTKGIALLTRDASDSKETQLANARLIAAAPDLLSSLRVLVSRLRTRERWPVEAEHIAYLADAEAAIAKAEGR